MNTNRVHLLVAAIACVVAAWATDVAAQTLSFTYVAPTSSFNAIFGVTPAATDTGAKVYEVGYGGLAITDANAARFRRSAPQNLVKTFDALQRGAPLRKRVDSVLRIGNRTDVTMELVDDRTGIGGTGTYATASYLPGGSYAWPAASTNKDDGTTALHYFGWIGLGTTACDTIVAKGLGGWKAWEGTIVHETFHTQFVGNSTKWGSNLVTYGGDENHWSAELLGDQPLPFNEGLATFFGLYDSPDIAQVRVSDWWKRTDERYRLESRSVLAGEKELVAAPRVAEERPMPAALGGTGTYTVFNYKWTDVPGFYVMFSEATTTAYHYYFYRFANLDPADAMKMIRTEAASMCLWGRKRDLTYAATQLALQLEDRAVATPVRAKLTSSMFPFALLDLMTHFGMTEETLRREFRANNPKRTPKALDAYFARRAEVKALVQVDLAQDPMDFVKAVFDVHQYFQQPATILATGS